MNIFYQLSTGDPRMLYGENPKKVVNLVTPIVPLYRQTYKSALDKISKFKTLAKLNNMDIDPKNNLYSQVYIS